MKVNSWIGCLWTTPILTQKRSSRGQTIGKAQMRQGVFWEIRSNTIENVIKHQSVRYRDLFVPIRRRRRKRNRKTAKMQKTNANKPWEINSGRHVLVLSARYFIYAVLCNSQKSLMRWVIISIFQWRSLLCKGGWIRIFPLLANFKSFPNSMSGRGGHTRGVRLVATWGDEEDPEHLEGSGVPRGKETRPRLGHGEPTDQEHPQWTVRKSEHFYSFVCWHICSFTHSTATCIGYYVPDTVLRVL